MLNRRNFIKTTVAGAVLTTGGTLLSSCQAQANEPKKNDSIPYKPEAELKLSLQDWNIPGENLQQKMDFLEKYNIVGVEFGGSGLAKRVKEIKEALKDIYTSLLQSLKDGDISLNPSEDACDYCRFHSICHFKGIKGLNKTKLTACDIGENDEVQ